MSTCVEHNVEAGIVRVDDSSVAEFLRADRTALVVVAHDCAWCEDYLAGIEIARALGDLRDLPVGVLHIDQPGAERFIAANEWLAEVEGLPYTALFRDGLRVDGFVAFNVFSLVDRLEYLAFLPTPVIRRRRTPAGFAV